MKYEVTYRGAKFGDKRNIVIANDLPSALALFLRCHPKVEGLSVEAIRRLDETPVYVTTYGMRRRYATRDEAVRFFEECAAGSEGSERERYENVLSQLRGGAHEVTDERRCAMKKY